MIKMITKHTGNIMRIGLTAFLLVSSVLLLAPNAVVLAGDGSDIGKVKIEKVPVDKQPKDTELLKVIRKAGVDPEYVETAIDYGKRNEGGSSPYSRVWKDKKSDKRFMEVSALPMVDYAGSEVDVGWYYTDGKYYTEGGGYNNVFYGVVDGSTVTLTAKNDQADGVNEGDTLVYAPQLFLAGEEINSPLYPTLQAIDPFNANYSNNTLTWDYGICVRNVRIIEGKYLEWWTFPKNPNGEVKIVHNQTGDFKLVLGEYATTDDIELVPEDAFKNKVTKYPFVVNGTVTFYPDSGAGGVDGHLMHNVVDDSWANTRDGTATAVHDDHEGVNVATIYSWGPPAYWVNMVRGIFTLDTSALPDWAVPISATFSLFGESKTQTAAWYVDINIFEPHPASNTALAIGDYDTGVGKFETTELSTTIAYADFSIVGYNDFALNATGLALVNLTGYTVLGTRDATYDATDTEPVWEDSKLSGISVWASEKGAGYKPKLYIVYEEPVPTVTTQAATAVTTTTATGNGNITDTGGQTPTYRGFETSTVAFTDPKVSFTFGEDDSSGISIKTGSDTIMTVYATDVIGGLTKLVKKTYTVSTDSWGAISDVYIDPTYECHGANGGVIGNNIYIFFNKTTVDTASFISQGYIKSTDLTGTSWGSYTALPTTEAQFVPKGTIVSTSDPDTFLQPWYECNAAETSFNQELYKTTDGGDTWALGGTISTGTFWCEGSVAYIGDGQMIAIMRDEAGGYPVRQSISYDDGDTWSTPAATNLGITAGDATDVKMVDITYDDNSDTVIAVIADRYDNTTFYSETDASTVFASATGWSPKITLDIAGTTNVGIPCVIKLSNYKRIILASIITAGGVYRYQYIFGQTGVTPGSFGTGAYTRNLTGLPAGVLMHYRAMAYNPAGWGYGSDVTFLTSSAASVQTNAAADISYTSATLQGLLVSTGGYDTLVCFEWGTSEEYGGTTTWQSKTTGEGFSAALTTLANGTTYYFRAVAKWVDETTTYGAGKSFTTLTAGVPTITTGAGTNLATTTATLQGTLTSLGDYTPVYVSFEYGLTVAYGTTTVEQTTTSATAFSADVSGLTQTTTYHFRARVRYGAVYVNGADASFITTTSAPAPGVPGIDEPDIMEIQDAKVISSYITDEDQLIVISYKLVYNAGNPAEPASDYFSFQVLLGTAIKAQVPVRMWGYRPGSIYLQPESALPVGSDLTVKLIGRADKWEAPVPEATYDITASDWLGTNLADIDPWVISLAENIQAYYNTQMVIYSAEGTVLSSQGGMIFSMGIPGLATVRPHLFASSIEYVDEGFLTNEDNLQPGLEPVARLGPYVSGIIADVGEDTFGTDLKDTWGFSIMIAFAALVVVVGLMVGFIPAIAASIPIVLIGMWTGGIAVAIVMVVAAVLVMFLLKSVWLRGN